MAQPDESKPETKRIYCNKCDSLTNHLLRGRQAKIYEERDNPSLWTETGNSLWVCAGCDSGTLEVSWTCSGDYDREGNQVYKFTYFPPRASDHLMPKNYRQLPKPLASIYTECIASFNSGLYLLCAAGLRALIEGICDDKAITGSNLFRKINGLKSLLPENIVECLHSFRFMGNDALHKLTKAKRDDLRLAVEVCEDLMNYLYELDYKTQKLPRRDVQQQDATKSPEATKNDQSR